MAIKNLLKSTLVLSLLFASTIAFCQQQMQQRPPEERAQRQTQWMQKNLALTDDQHKKVYRIILNSARKVDNARSMPAGPDRRSNMQHINTERDASLKAVLTGEQYQKYEQHVLQMREKMQQIRSGDMQDGE